jgi:hypothetical protein
MVDTALAPVKPNGSTVAMSAPLTASDVRAQVNLIQQVVAEVMIDGEHYGVIPGTAPKDGKPPKKTLLKAGAEKLCLTFRLDPQYEITERYDGDHLTVSTKCTLFHIPTGNRMGSGLGSCSTKESKYAYRMASRRCPKCNKEAIIKGKEEYGGGWLCFDKKGGCKAKYQDGDASIESQTIGRVENEDKADQYNTVLKMSNKRALVAAVLNVTAASDIFTQDLEDVPLVVPDEAPKTAPPATVKDQPKPPPAPAKAPGWVGTITAVEQPKKGTWQFNAIGDDGNPIVFLSTVPEHAALASEASQKLFRVSVSYVTNTKKYNVVKSIEPIVAAGDEEVSA